MAQTGICMLTGDEFQVFHEYIEKLMNRPVYTHELASKEVWEEIKKKSEDDFMNLCKEAVTDGWVKCEDRLPEEGKQVLVYYEYFRYGEYNRMWPAYGVGYQYDGHWAGDVSGLKLKVVAWQPFPDYEGEMEIEEELPFK
jgi:hypothetical protein